MLELLVAANQTLYCASFVPQIIQSLRQRSTAGLSELFLFATANSYFFYVLYFTCLGLPYSYRASAGIQLVLSGSLVLQSWLYAHAEKRRRITGYLLVNMGMMIGTIMLALWAPVCTGNAAGWIALALVIVCRLPQIMQHYHARSTKGLSIGFSLLTAVAGLNEIILSLVYAFPLQTLCSSLWACATACVFIIQRIMYKK